MTGPVIGRSRVLNTLVVAPPQVVGDEHAEAPVVVGGPDSGPPTVVGWRQVGDPLNIGGSAAGSRPVWVGHGLPVDVEGAVIRDLYLDLDTYDLYQLGG